MLVCKYCVEYVGAVQKGETSKRHDQQQHTYNNNTFKHEETEKKTDRTKPHIIGRLLPFLF